MAKYIVEKGGEPGTEEGLDRGPDEGNLLFDVYELEQLLHIISNDLLDERQLVEDLVRRLFPGARLEWTDLEVVEEEPVPSEHEVRTKSDFFLRSFCSMECFDKKLTIRPPEGVYLDMSGGRMMMLRIMIRELEKKREKQARQLETAQTVAALIHNMRNAVTVVSMWNDLNAQTTVANTEGDRSLLTSDKFRGDVRLSLDRLRDMSALALKIIMKGEGELKPSLKRVSVNHLIEDTQRKFPDHTITTNLSGNQDLNLMVDINFLNQVLDNLIVNAYKYGHYRGVPLEIGFHKTGNLLVIQVVDQGQGIKENPEKLFEFGYRADKSKPDGYGIGLAFSRQIIEAMGGSIMARNNFDSAGATFAIYFPMV